MKCALCLKTFNQRYVIRATWESRGTEKHGAVHETCLRKLAQTARIVSSSKIRAPKHHCALCGNDAAYGRKLCSRCQGRVTRGIMCGECGVLYTAIPRAKYTNHCEWCDSDNGVILVGNWIAETGYRCVV